MMSAWIDMGPWGLIPEMIDASSDKGAAEQLNEGYAHGGGFPNGGDHESTTVYWNEIEWVMAYPGDPIQKAVDYMYVGDETVVLFPYSFVAVVQEDGSFVMGRMD